MKKTFFLLPLLILALTLQDAAAQGGIGASYERRDNQPREGIGMRLEKMFGDPQAVLNFGILAHTSFFSNTVTLDRGNNGNNGVVFRDTELSTFDFGAAVKVAANLPFVTPYAMAGLGYENYKIQINSEYNGIEVPKNNRTPVVNGTVGVQVRLLNAIRPFAEIRYSKNFNDYKFEETFDNIKAAKNRVAFGVSLYF